MFLSPHISNTPSILKIHSLATLSGASVQLLVNADMQSANHMAALNAFRPGDTVKRTW